MNTYPLIKVRWSNEHIMAGMYLVLILYHLPLWIDSPAGIIHFLQLTAVGLLLDAAANIIRYKRLWCCVSGAVTAAIISLLTPGIPVWEQLIGLAAALVFGKYIWGGTGKNRVNPAMLGMLVITLVWSVPYPIFKPSYLFLPAIILSLPFLKIRPHAGLGFTIGSLAALLVTRDISIASLLSDGILFWSCIVLTDPVTVTRNRLVGSVAGFLGGFLALFLSPNTLNFVTVILTINVLSYVLEGKFDTFDKVKSKFNITKAVSCNPKLLDLTDGKVLAEKAELGVEELTAEEIIRNLKHNEVFGMGGAAFPTDQKLATVRQAKVKKKYLIINGVECDPGLFHDSYILNTITEEIIKGINILKNYIEFTSVHLAVKSTEGFSFPNEIKIHKVSDRYPAGAEKILIKEILNLSLTQNQIPADYGILVLNVQTVYSIYQAIYLNSPADTRYLTVADMKAKTAQIVKVRLGTRLYDIMQAVYPNSTSIFAGGGMMQSHAASEEDVVDKNINFIASGGIPKFKESPQCSHCGDCVSHCPAGLKVNKIADLVDQGRLKDTIKYTPSECIGCGSCSYSCRAGRNLSMKVKAAKNVEMTK